MDHEVQGLVVTAGFDWDQQYTHFSDGLQHCTTCMITLLLRVLKTYCYVANEQRVFVG